MDHELSFGVNLNPCPGRNSSWLIGWLICSSFFCGSYGAIESERCCSARRNAGMWI